METALPDTIHYLGLLNRKERFHLLREALGKKTFRLDERFRIRLQSCLYDSPCDAVSIPPDAFVAMDYHLDWIAMALRLAADGPERARRDRFPLDGIANDGLVSGTQQDVDLLVAFPAGNLRDSRVCLEHRTDTGRSIDIVVRVRGDTWIGIENKPWAGEQPNQVSDYLKYLQTIAGTATDTDTWLVYLSGDGKRPETLPDDPEDRMRCPTLPYRGAERGSPSLENWVEKFRTECEAERVRWFLTDLLEYIRKRFEPAEPTGTGDRS